MNPVQRTLLCWCLGALCLGCYGTDLIGKYSGQSSYGAHNECFLKGNFSVSSPCGAAEAGQYVQWGSGGTVVSCGQWRGVAGPAVCAGAVVDTIYGVASDVGDCLREGMDWTGTRSRREHRACSLATNITVLTRGLLRRQARLRIPACHSNRRQPAQQPR